MNHIDVGTIHAWLDGALDAAQSREIEAHIAECSVCSAAVAEERGMIAGASRILLALDDVPAGVTPKRAPRRQWRAAPWVTGIAAALILVVGVTTWNRDAVQKEMTTARDQAASAPVYVPSAAPPAPADTIARLPSLGGTAANIASDVAAQALRQTKTQPTRERRRAPAEPVRVTAVPPLAPTLSNRAMADAARESRAEITRVDELAGCYSVKSPEVGKGVVPRVAAGVEAAAQRTAKAAAPAAARADYAVPAAPEAALPAVVRLDTARKRAGYAVLSATSDSLIGFWNVTGDSANADLLMRGVFAISQRNRVDCPER